MYCHPTLSCLVALRCKVWCSASSFNHLQGGEGSLQALQGNVTVFTVLQQTHQPFTQLNRQERHRPLGSSNSFSKPKALGWLCLPCSLILLCTRLRLNSSFESASWGSMSIFNQRCSVCAYQPSNDRSTSCRTCQSYLHLLSRTCAQAVGHGNCSFFAVMPTVSVVSTSHGSTGAHVSVMCSGWQL